MSASPSTPHGNARPAWWPPSPFHRYTEEAAFDVCADGDAPGDDGLIRIDDRLAFIAGDEAYETVAVHIAAAERFLAPGGWLCFGNAFLRHEAVHRAIRDLVINSGKYERCEQLTRQLFVARRRIDA